MLLLNFFKQEVYLTSETELFKQSQIKTLGIIYCVVNVRFSFVFFIVLEYTEKVNL